MEEDLKGARRALDETKRLLERALGEVEHWKGLAKKAAAENEELRSRFGVRR